MEETVTGVTPGRARLCVALLVLMGFALGCSEFIVIGIESNLAEEMGVSLATAGQLISLFALPYAVMTPVLALATGRFRRYSVMLVYLVIFCVGNALSTFAPSFGVLLAARVLLGSVSGALLAVGVTFIPELVGAKRSSGALTLVYRGDERWQDPCEHGRMARCHVRGTCSLAYCWRSSRRFHAEKWPDRRARNRA